MTTKKRHFDEGAWSDFARGLTSGEPHARMEEHLNRGCAECHGALRFIQELIAFAKADAAVEVPEHLVAEAVSLFRGPSPASNWLETLEQIAAELVFEIRREWQLEGVRSAGSGGHRLVYRGGDYAIDLSIEPGPTRGIQSLTGQIESDVGELMDGSVVQVWVGGTNVAEARTNEFGEFVAEYPEGMAAELRIGLVHAGRRLNVLLPESN